MSRRGRHDVHRGRVTIPDDPPRGRPRSTAVVVTAWVVVGGLTLAVVIPVLVVLFG